MWSFLFLIFLTLSGIVMPMSMFNSFHQVTSLLPSNYYVTVSIVLPPKNLPLLQQYVQDHVVLNQTEVQRLFVPQKEITQIISKLRNYNISTVNYLNVILASGKVGELEEALNGKFYVYAVNGIRFYEFSGSPTFSNVIVIGTNVTSLFLKKPTTLYNITQAVAYTAVYPNELIKAYNVSWLQENNITGKGTAIGILDFYGDPYIQQQIQAFDSSFNISNPPYLKIVPIGAYNPNEGISTGWAMEISLDVEYAHIIAPDAGIVLYVANPNIPLPAIIAYIDQQDEVNVLSQSFGIPELYVDLGLIPLSYVNSLMYEYWLGEVEGITFVAASGDAGGNGYNYYLSPKGSVIFPASIPYVLAVGGSSLYFSQNEVLQTAWSGESVIGASTGGYSSIFPAPYYQNISGYRLVPDVVADANPYTGAYILYYYNQTYLVGGTSLANPMVSAMIDLLSQKYGKLGFINPYLYELKDTKAILPIEFGYNTPYYVNSSLNPVTGLGSINAGYLFTLLPKVLNQPKISVAVYNITYLDGQQVKVVANISGEVLSRSVTGYVYNGSSIVDVFPLTFNGTSFVGKFIAEGDGIQEVIVKDGNLTGFTYITVGYQAQFIFPPVALFPEPESVPILVQLTYPNGSVVSKPPSNLTINVYKYDLITGRNVLVSSMSLSRQVEFNLSLLGITIQSQYLGATFQLSNNVNGVYFVNIPNVFGFDEFVAGIYLLDAVYPPIFTEPLTVAPGQNVTILAETLALGEPNLTISFYNESGYNVYSIPVNSILYQNTLVYITQIKMPDLKPGYYLVVAKATYNGSNFTAEGVGITQIYVAPYTINVKVNIYPSNVVYENENLTVIANITYPNGTEVKYGTFSAIVIPAYMLNNFDNLELEYSVPLTYDNGSWIGNFQIPNGNQNNPFSSSPYGISGYWYVYIEGITGDGLPISFPASLDVNSLTINPITPNKEFVVLPYIYVNSFNGTLAYNEYINEALIFNHNATFINSIINKLVVVNGSVNLINSKVINISALNAKILNINSSYYHTSTVTITSSPVYTRASNTTINVNNILLPMGILIDVITIIIVFLLRRKGYI